MKVELRKSHISEARSDLLCVFLMQDEEPPFDIQQYFKDVKKERYEGKLLQSFSAAGRGSARHLLVVGLGKKEEFKTDYLRRAAGAAVRSASALKEKEFAMHLPAKFVPREQQQKMAQAMAEGAILAGYRFLRYKTKKDEIFTVENAYVVTEEDVSDGGFRSMAVRNRARLSDG